MTYGIRSSCVMALAITFCLLSRLFVMFVYESEIILQSY